MAVILANQLRNRLQTFTKINFSCEAFLNLLCIKSKQNRHKVLHKTFKRYYASSGVQSEPQATSHLRDFAVLLDIDGVLIRGRKPIPEAKIALQRLRDLRVQTMLLTNGGCELEKKFAERISSVLDIEVCRV